MKPDLIMNLADKIVCLIGAALSGLLSLVGLIILFALVIPFAIIGLAMCPFLISSYWGYLTYTTMEQSLE